MAALLVNATAACAFSLAVLTLGHDAGRYLWSLVRRPAVLTGRA